MPDDDKSEFLPAKRIWAGAASVGVPVAGVLGWLLSTVIDHGERISHVETQVELNSTILHDKATDIEAKLDEVLEEIRDR